MLDFTSVFPATSLSDWTDQLKKDLNEKDFQKIHFKDDIEELEIKAVQNGENVTIQHSIPGEFPFLRGTNKTSNEWTNGIFIHEPNAAALNRKAIDALMNGADSLTIDLSFLIDDFQKAFENIGFEYIHSNFILQNTSQLKELYIYFQNQLPDNCWLHVDYIQNQDKELFDTVLERLRSEQFPAFVVNGFRIQQGGATSWQEIAFCLATGHEYLIQLINNGLTIDEASASIHFQIGIGSNYLIEIAKIRVLRMLWAKIIEAYAPIHNCSCAMQLGAVIGTMNKSLLDPHTNLLRQTTEIMAAVAGGAHHILALPYDAHAENGASELAQRMAINISLLLKEESYFDKVIDPLGGSYVIEDLSQQIAGKSWTFFQELEKLGGTFSPDCMEFLRKAIDTKRTLRIESIKSVDKLLIGINKFQLNNKASQLKCKSFENYLNIPALNYELEFYKGV
jgi:methylmalonyl-CoA mutase